VDAELPEIVIEVRDGNIVLISDDEEALDKLEARLQSLMAHMSPKTTWTIFYLRSADATEAATMLEKLFPQSSVLATASDSGSSLFGELTGGISSLGSSLMDMTGINSLQSGPMALRIIPETRANALFVAGPADQVADVESVLKILDAAELPAQLRARAPRYITVQHADINEVAQIVRDVYKEELTASSRSRGGSSGQSSNPFAALMGGGGGSSRGGSSRGGSSRQGGGGGGVKMTLGVDTRTSALVVSASDSLFKQVEALVTTLDTAAKDARRTVRIVTLQSTNSSAIQQAVQALLPKTSVSTGGSSRSSGPTSFGPSSRTSSRGGSSAAGGDQADRIRQMMQMRQQQGRGGSTSSRGGSSRGSSGGSPFGGGSSRGSSGRSSPFGGSSRGSSRGR
jgi:type II secretory pathway component GspD/PulD (secretin)